MVYARSVLYMLVYMLVYIRYTKLYINYMTLSNLHSTGIVKFVKKYYMLTGTLYNKIQEFYKIYTCNQACFPIVSVGGGMQKPPGIHHWTMQSLFAVC